MDYPRRETGMRNETTWDKWFRLLTRKYGFDGTKMDPGTANVLATAIAQGRIDPRGGDFKKLKKSRRQKVYHYYEEICSQRNIRPSKNPDFTSSFEARSAVDLETKEFEDAGFSSDKIGEIYDVYYYGKDYKPSREDVKIFQEMYSRISQPSRHTREIYGK